MTTIRMTASGFGNNKNFLDDLINNSQQRSQIIFHKLAEDIVVDARHNLQQNLNIDSGRLLASIRILQEDENVIIIGSDLEHALYIEFGRGPVFAPEGKVLHFVSKDTGKDVFVTEVGPVDPMPFLEPAVLKHIKAFTDAFTELNKDVIKRQVSGFLDSELL